MLAQDSDEVPEVGAQRQWGWTGLVLQAAFAETQVHRLLSCLSKNHFSFETTLRIGLTAAPSSPWFAINAAPELGVGHALFISSGSRVTQGTSESMNADVSTAPSVNRWRAG